MQARGVYLYPFFSLGARWDWVVKATLGPLYPRWLLPNRGSNPGPSSPQRVAIPRVPVQVIKEFRASGVCSC